MIRIGVVNDSPERWVPVIERSFQMTLAPLEGALRSLWVELSGPSGAANDRSYTCTLAGTTTLGRSLSISSRHGHADQAIVHAFTRARRELRRGGLRPPMPPGRIAEAEVGISGTDARERTR